MHPHEDDAEHEEEHEEVEISLADALKEMEKIINTPNAGENFKKFNQLKEKASHYIHDEVEDKKHEYVEAGNALKISAMSILHKQNSLLW
jgi:hypothetical protein